MAILRESPVSIPISATLETTSKKRLPGLTQSQCETRSPDSALSQDPSHIPVLYVAHIAISGVYIYLTEGLFSSK